MGVTTVTNFFQNFEVDTKIPKSPKLALITKILKKILKTKSMMDFEAQDMWFQDWLSKSHVVFAFCALTKITNF